MIADHPAVQGVTVTVHKPKAPITVPFADVSVTIERWRSGRNTDGKTGRADEGRVTPMHHAVIALGGNKGDVAASMRSAIADIDGLEGTQVTGISPLYRTAAWGMPDGTPDFSTLSSRSRPSWTRRICLAACSISKLLMDARGNNIGRRAHWILTSSMSMASSARTRM